MDELEELFNICNPTFVGFYHVYRRYFNALVSSGCAVEHIPIYLDEVQGLCMMRGIYVATK